MALRCGLTTSIRSRNAVTTSRADTSLARISRVSGAAPSRQSGGTPSSSPPIRRTVRARVPAARYGVASVVFIPLHEGAGAAGAFQLEPMGQGAGQVGVVGVDVAEATRAGARAPAHEVLQVAVERSRPLLGDGRHEVLLRPH